MRSTTFLDLHQFYWVLLGSFLALKTFCSYMCMGISKREGTVRYTDWEQLLSSQRWFNLINAALAVGQAVLFFKQCSAQLVSN